jgi:hypothetical protein
VRFVSLATDHAPTYAAWAPVCARFWRRVGYRSIVHVESVGWDSAFGELVLGELSNAGAILVRVEAAAPLSIVDTMRVVRLVAAGNEQIGPDDFVLMADVDMLPLDEAFFADRAGLIALRALAYGWAKLPIGQIVPTIGASSWRLPMCYVGAPASVWRTLLPVDGDPRMAVSAIRRMQPECDGYNLDETLMSRVVFERAGIAPIEDVSNGVWRKGDLHLVDPIHAPHHSQRRKIQRGMLGAWSDEAARRERMDGMLDFMPARFERGANVLGDLDVAALYAPDEKTWIDRYRSRLQAVLEPALWS